MINWYKNRQLDKRISNFDPNKTEGNKLVRTRIKHFIRIVIALLFIEAIGIAVLWATTSKEQVKILLIVLIVLHAIATATYVLILDNGAANKLKKDNFKVSNKKIEQGHTYYYALKKSGFIRLFINIAMIAALFILVLVVFLI